jgi:uncharacterized membrane protein
MGKVVAVLNGLLIAAYPVAVYFGLTRFSTRGLGLVLLVLLLPSVLTKLRSARREDLVVVLRLPLTVITLVVLGIILNDRRFVLALPVLINLALLIQFAGSLRATPMVERFARMQDPNLGPLQVRYCRTVTQVWCVFFAINASISLALAWLADVAVWALYTGLVAYVLIGVVATVEYVVRKARFREYSGALHDRLIARVFPPRAGVQS